MKKSLAFLVLAASLPGAAFALDAKFNAFMGSVVGNSVTVGFGTGGTPLATSASHLGTAYPVGNMAIGGTAGAPALQGRANVPISGTARTLPVDVKAPITKAAYLAGVARVLSGPTGFVALSAAPYVIDWLRAGGVGINQNPSDLPDKPFTLKYSADGKEYNVGSAGWAGSPSSACALYAQKSPADVSITCLYQHGPSYYRINKRFCNIENGTCSEPREMSVSMASRNTQNTDTLPASLNDILPYMDKPEVTGFTPQTVQQGIVTAGIDPFGAEKPAIEVTGPASVPGEKTTTTSKTKVQPGTTIETADPAGQPATKTTTKTEAVKAQYQGPKVTTSTITTTETIIRNDETGQEQKTNDGTTETSRPDDDITKPQEQPEIETCGLPGKPPCRIDELDTPTDAPTQGQEKLDEWNQKMQEQREQIKESGTGIFDSFKIFFSAPPVASCTPYPLPRDMGVIDPCPVVDGVRAVMAYIWAIGGLWLCIGWIREAI